ncbi:MAG: hypothetical protein JWM80_1987 [Cyanobacteria bacterium RYN_339]|nr:hypothetical protein [Cyanobacteria bacterium RYN_339]
MIPAGLATFQAWGGVVAYGIFPDHRAALAMAEGDSARAVSRRVSVAEWLGPYFDRGLLQRGRSAKHLNDYFRLGDAETPANAVRVVRVEHSITQGYADAFADPPYSMQATPAEIDRLFYAFADELWGGLREDLEVLRWSTDWAACFAAGDEWWGSFFWTVRAPGADHVVGILASATD